MLLSVIIPSRNRGVRLASLLDSLSCQEPVSFKWEVIVIDNGSTDDTAEIVRNKQNSLPICIRYIYEKVPGLHAGRNRGAKEANGRYLGYLDDDMILQPTWLQGVELLVEKKADAVVGRIFPKWEGVPPVWLSNLATANNTLGYLGLLDMGEVQKPVPYFFGGNLFIAKKTVLELGGFHPDSMPPDLIRFRGDGESGLWFKFQKAQLQLWYDYRATVYHIISPERLTPQYFCTRAYAQGISDSYTAIRSVKGKIGAAFVFRKRLRQVILLLRALKKQYFSHGNSHDGGLSKVKFANEKSYWDGYWFHQREVRADKELFEWVMKESYL